MWPDATQAGGLNTTPTEPENPTARPPAILTEPDFSGPVRLIAEVAALPDFPKCALGVHLDISGYVGVAVQIVKQSLRVKSREGVIQSFNSQRLRQIYAPAPREEFVEPTRNWERPQAAPKPLGTPAADPMPAGPPRVFIEEPDFDLPVRPITEFVDREDFPKCAYGEQVAIAEFTGVVVELVRQSLKVRSADGILRSYNGPILRKLYGAAAQ